MALLFMDGFDAGDAATKWSSVEAVDVLVSSAATPYGIGRSLETSNIAEIIRPFTPSAQATVGLAYQPVSGTSRLTISFYADSGTIQHISLERNSSTGILEVNRGGSLLATGTTVLSAGTWYYLELQVTVADSGGTVKVRLNGAQTNEIDFTGDTKNGGTSTLIDAINIKNASLTNRVDNLYVLNSTGSINNTFLGVMRVHTLTPNGDGASSQFTGSDGNQVDNYQLVDELPSSTSDFVASTVSGRRDTYSLDNLPSGYHQISGLQSNIVSLKNTAGSVGLKAALRSNGALYYGTSRFPGTNAQTTSDLFETSPVTSQVWTSAEINNLEGGMEII